MTKNSDVSSDAGQPRPQNTQWYALHCAIGSEERVQEGLSQRVAQQNMADKIFQIVIVPGRRVYPAYILVEMVLDEATWDLVVHTPGVRGFVGKDNSPLPLDRKDVDKLLKYAAAKKSEPQVNLDRGQSVRIVEGPFADYRGVVETVDLNRARVLVMVNFFGRETPVELDFQQVEPTASFGWPYWR